MHDDDDNECDLFETKSCKRDKKDEPSSGKVFVLGLKSLWKIGGATVIFLGIGGGGYLVRNYSRGVEDSPIMVHPVDQPLKVKPEIKVEVIGDDDIIDTDESTSKPTSKRQNIIYEKIEKKRAHSKKMNSSSSRGASESDSVSKEDRPQKSAGVSYYVCFGHFDNHYDASIAWQKIKGDRFDDLKDVEPIVRVVASNDGRCYQLLAGPVTKELGLKLSREFKTTLLSVDS